MKKIIATEDESRFMTKFHGRHYSKFVKKRYFKILFGLQKLPFCIRILIPDHIMS